MKPKVVFFGTPRLAATTLAEINPHYQVVGVITESDKPSGRGQQIIPTPVKEQALALELPVWQPETSDDIAAVISKLKPDFGVLVAYGKIIPQTVIDLFPLGIINIHGSLLPKYRGASPVQYAILNGDRETGATLMLLEAGVDTGPTIGQAVVKIDPTDTTVSLADKIITAGTAKLLSVLPGYLSGRIKPQPQGGSVTYAPKIAKADGLIDWNHPAATIERQIRAFTPWPKSWTQFRGRKLIIHQAQVTSDGLVPEVVQLEGKSKMPWPEFLNGYRLNTATALKEITGLDRDNHS